MTSLQEQSAHPPRTRPPEAGSPLAWTSGIQCDHGRIEYRELRGALRSQRRPVPQSLAIREPHLPLAEEKQRRAQTGNPALSKAMPDSPESAASTGRGKQEPLAASRRPMAGRPQRAPQTRRREKPRTAPGCHSGARTTREVHLAQRRLRPLHGEPRRAIRLLTQSAPQSS